MGDFGVYQPPSGINNIRRSTQINSINNLNNPRRRFDEMIQQGWGGNMPSPTLPPAASPAPSSSPSGTTTTLTPPLSLPTGCSILAVILREDDITLGFRNGQPVLIPTSEHWQFGLTEYIEKPEWEDQAFLASTDSSGIWYMEQFSGPWYELGFWDDFVTNADPLDQARKWRLGGIISASPQCGDLSPSPSPSPSPSFGGNAAPPPPPGKDMCGCDCNTIATIIEDKIANINRDVKNHIDQRTIEELKAVNKMLQGMNISLNLQPVIDRLNEVEANLWNGPGG